MIGIKINLGQKSADWTPWRIARRMTFPANWLPRTCSPDTCLRTSHSAVSGLSDYWRIPGIGTGAIEIKSNQKTSIGDPSNTRIMTCLISDSRGTTRTPTRNKRRVRPCWRWHRRTRRGGYQGRRVRSGRCSCPCWRECRRSCRCRGECRGGCRRRHECRGGCQRWCECRGRRPCRRECRGRRPCRRECRGRRRRPDNHFLRPFSGLVAFVRRPYRVGLDLMRRVSHLPLSLNRPKWL